MNITSSPYSPVRRLYFTKHKYTVYRGYLSRTAIDELEKSGNEVIRLPNCWIIKSREGQ